MSACEKCWRDASQRAWLLGGSVTEHYHALLDERRDNPCAPEEAMGSATSIDARLTDSESGKAIGSAENHSTPAVTPGADR